MMARRYAGTERRAPSPQDLATWARINHDLLDWLYEGVTGRLQIAGHRVLDDWAREHAGGFVLEVGCGHGHHLRYGGDARASYLGLDIEHKFLKAMRERFPGVMALRGDAYTLPLADDSIDCVLSVYTFEHLRVLPTALSEIRRVLRPRGELLVGLPAEGGLAYGLGRALTSKRYMERRYGIDYDAIVRWEHWNSFWDVRDALERDFVIREQRFVPFGLPSAHVNAVVCLRGSARES